MKYAIALASRRLKDRSTRGRALWYAYGAMVGLSCGLIVAILGSICTVISWIEESGSMFAKVGTVLLILTIPLLILGAHCLDAFEATGRNKSTARKHMTIDEDSSEKRGVGSNGTRLSMEPRAD